MIYCQILFYQNGNNQNVSSQLASFYGLLKLEKEKMLSKMKRKMDNKLTFIGFLSTLQNRKFYTWLWKTVIDLVTFCNSRKLKTTYQKDGEE